MALPADLARTTTIPNSAPPPIAAAIAKLKPRHVLFAESAEGGADLARRVAAVSGERLFSGVEAITGGSASRGGRAAAGWRCSPPRRA